MISSGPNINRRPLAQRAASDLIGRSGLAVPAKAAGKYQSKNVSDVPASPLDRFQLYLGDEEHAFLLLVSAILSGRLDLHWFTVTVEKVADTTPELRFRYRGGENSGSFVAGEEKSRSPSCTKPRIR